MKTLLFTLLATVSFVANSQNTLPKFGNVITSLLLRAKISLIFKNYKPPINVHANGMNASFLSSVNLQY